MRVCFKARHLLIEVTPHEARYVLLDGDPLELSHHGDALTVERDRPVTLPVAPIATRPRPAQPPGRAPARRRPRAGRVATATTGP